MIFSGAFSEVNFVAFFFVCVCVSRMVMGILFVLCIAMVGLFIVNLEFVLNLTISRFDVARD